MVQLAADPAASPSVFNEKFMGVNSFACFCHAASVNQDPVALQTKNPKYLVNPKGGLLNTIMNTIPETFRKGGLAEAGVDCRNLLVRGGQNQEPKGNRHLV